MSEISVRVSRSPFDVKVTQKSIDAVLKTNKFQVHVSKLGLPGIKGDKGDAGLTDEDLNQRIEDKISWKTGDW